MMDWQTGTVVVNDEEYATRNANGVDLMYPGPDGTLHFQGAPVSGQGYPHVVLTQKLQREWGSRWTLA